jgi:hypothetical protein
VKHGVEAMTTNTMHDTYIGHKNVADFIAEDGHEFFEIWQRKVGTPDHSHVILLSQTDNGSQPSSNCVKPGHWTMTKSVLG